MENRFRLVKWYPGLPEEWKEGEVIAKKVKKSETGQYAGKYRAAKSGSSVKYLEPKHVCNNPWYWEKIYKQNFEVLEFENQHREVMVLREDGLYYLENVDCTDKWATGAEFDALRKDSNWKIRTVKCLETNAVYSLGDKVSIGGDKIFTILYFSLMFSTDAVTVPQYMVAILNDPVYNRQISYLTLEQKTFGKTADGEYLYEGSTATYVNRDMKVYRWRTHWDNAGEENVLSRTFKHAANAEKFIENNKPSYSKEDLRKALNDTQSCYDCEYITYREMLLKKLEEELVKKKRDN